MFVEFLVTDQNASTINNEQKASAYSPVSNGRMMPGKQKEIEFTGYLSQVHARLFDYVHSLVRNMSDADEIVQKTSLILWEKFDSYDRKRSFFAWASGVARFEVLNFVRSRGRDKLFFGDEVAKLIAEETELKSELLEQRESALSVCIQKLVENDQELVRKCYLEDSLIEDVAASLSRSTHSVYNSLRRIRKLLFECVNRAVQKEYDGQVSA